MKSKVLLVSAVAAGVGLVLLSIELFIDPARAAVSYLFGFMTVLSTLLGVLILLLIAHAADARWLVAIRRMLEHLLGALPLVAVLAVPWLAALPAIYPWTDISQIPEHVRALVEHKASWLSEGWFIARAVLLLGIVVGLSELLRRWSWQQDDASPAQREVLRRRMASASAGTLPLMALVISFMAWDWLMSLDPTWYSNIYGVLLFASGFVSSLALVAVCMVGARRAGLLPSAVGVEHRHAVGRLLFAFVVFWAYIQFCQGLLMWIADQPHEVTWYLARIDNGWQWVGIGLIIGHFVIPFLYLLSRATKRHPTTLVAISVWLLAAHVVEMHYLIVPSLYPMSFDIRLSDVGAVLLLVGITALATGLRARRSRHVAEGDPRIGLALAYRSWS